MTEPYITLREALESGRLSDFTAREDTRGIGPIDRAGSGFLSMTLNPYSNAGRLSWPSVAAARPGVKSADKRRAPLATSRRAPR